ncbi:roadblock/LC7 domain-containing protein [Streptomyces sp. NPDC050560]|uniref:roadblock/LC7 domain-containing protein n=1 Tax=Streptomyces sp. NPDC050560 TaxID=3365630 RepID=UPI0037B0CDEF
MSGTIAQLPDLGWMLRPLVEIPGVRHAVVVSEDGLRLGHASAEGGAELGVDDAEKLAAASAALAMTGRSTSALLYGADVRVRQQLVETDQGFILFTSAGVGAHLGVVTGPDADMGLVAQQMQLLVVRIGDKLSSLPRQQVSPSP